MFLLQYQKQRPNVERVAACIRQHHPQYSNETVHQVRVQIFFILRCIKQASKMPTRWLFFWDSLHCVSLHLRVAANVRQHHPQYSNETDHHSFWIERFKRKRLKIKNFENSYWPKQAHRPPNVKPLPPTNCTKHGCSHQTCSVTVWTIWTKYC